MDFSALNDIPKFIGVRWDALAGYTAGALCSFQSAKSLWRGSKEVLTAFLGEENFNERIHKAATDNLNIFLNAKNVLVSSDSFAKRFKHFHQGLENLFIGGISGLFAYLLFFEVFKESFSKPFSKPEAYGEFEINFKSNVQNSQKQVFPYQEKICFWAIFSHPNVHNQLEKCKEAGYLDENFDFDALQDALEKREISKCLRIYELFLKARSLFVQDPVFVEAVENYVQENPNTPLLTNDQPSNAQITHSSNPDFSLATSVFDNQNWTQLDVVVKDYFNRLERQIQVVIKQSEEFLNRHQNRLRYCKEYEMQAQFGPFSIDLAQVCDLGFLNKLPFASKELTSKICRQYQTHQENLNQAVFTFKNTETSLSLDFTQISCEEIKNEYLRHLTEATALLSWRQFKFLRECEEEERKRKEEALRR